MVDGLKTNGSAVQCWAYNVPGNTAVGDFTTGYATISGSSVLNAEGWIVNFDATALAQGVFWASSLNPNTQSSTGDYTYQFSTSGDYVAYHGGSWSFGTLCGLFFLYVDFAPSNSYETIGARLAKM
jgi:hypothetical protein